MRHPAAIIFLYPKRMGTFEPLTGMAVQSAMLKKAWLCGGRSGQMALRDLMCVFDKGRAA